MSIQPGLEPQGSATLSPSLKPMLFEWRPGYLFQTPLSFYNITGDDAAIFNAGCSYLATRYGMGTIELGHGFFIGKSQATPIWGIQGTSPNVFGNINVQGQGANTIWQQQFTGNAWYAHRTTSYGGQYGNPAQPAVGHLRDFVIDGTNAGNNSVGLHFGDGWGDGRLIDLRIVNYSQANGTGAIQQNTIAPAFWLEKNTGIYLNFSNNQNTFIIDTGAGSTSAEYNEYHICMFCNSNQQGIQLINGINMGGSNLFLYGNMSTTSSSGATPTNNVAMLSLLNGSRWYYGSILAKVEGNPGNGTGTTYPWTLYSDGNGYIRQCEGRITTSLNDIQMNGAEFGFAGFIGGNPKGASLYPTGNAGSGGTSTSAPAMPASNTWFHNTSVSQTVCWTGGTISSVKIGTPTTNIPVPTNAGQMVVEPGAYFNFTYTVAPTTFTMFASSAGD